MRAGGCRREGIFIVAVHESRAAAVYCDIGVFCKGSFYLLNARKIVGMVKSDIEYHGERREKVQERIHIFARLENEKVLAA